MKRRGLFLDAINKVTNDEAIFVYGISDKTVGGIEVQEPDGNLLPVFPAALGKDSLPSPFKERWPEAAAPGCITNSW